MVTADDWNAGHLIEPLSVGPADLASGAVGPGQIAAGAVGPAHIDAMNEPCDGCLLAYDPATGRFRWAEAVGGYLLVPLKPTQAPSTDYRAVEYDVVVQKVCRAYQCVRTDPCAIVVGGQCQYGCVEYRSQSCI